MLSCAWTALDASVRLKARPDSIAAKDRFILYTSQKGKIFIACTQLA
jgi:hypothetical protein